MRSFITIVMTSAVFIILMMPVVAVLMAHIIEGPLSWWFNFWIGMLP